jgi:outer membrane protein assembly factor BamD
MRFFKSNLYIIFIILISLLYGCSTPQLESQITQAEILYREAQNYIKKERYILATEKLNQIKSQYPYSYFATNADFLMAEVLYLQENYPEASAAYLLFKELHPKNDKIDLVLWKLAESYYMQLPSTFDRDLSVSKDALKYYQEYLDKYPNSDKVAMIRTRIDEINLMLLNRDKYIANFYFKTDVLESAKLRYLDIIKKVTDEETEKLSKERILEITYTLNQFDECLKYANQFITDSLESIQKIAQKYQTKCSEKKND